MPDIHICFTTDQAFGRYLYFSIASIILSAAPEDILHFHILDHEMNEVDKNRLHKLVQAPAELEFVRLDYDSFALLPPVRHLSPAIYGKLLIPNLLPALDKIIFLDVDTIVRASLAPLWQTELGQFALAATADSALPNHDVYAKSLGLLPENYFNSGVLLLDCQKWRADKISERLIEAGKGKQYLFHDQDILNVFFKSERNLLNVGIA